MERSSAAKVRSRGQWVTTFDRFPPGPTPLVGPIEVQVADWSRPQPGHAPMFEDALFEKLSVAHPAVPFAIYAPLGFWLLWREVTAGASLALAVSMYGLGLLVWSLLEYVAHRGSFHHNPNTRAQVAYTYLVHGVHHAYPEDSRRWVMPVVVTLPIATLLYVLADLALGSVGRLLFAGFIHGYLVYDLLHYSIHRGRLPTPIGRFLRHYHLKHHYACPDRHYGVSSPLWDVVFRTK